MRWLSLDRLMVLWSSSLLKTSWIVLRIRAMLRKIMMLGSSLELRLLTLRRKHSRIIRLSSLALEGQCWLFIDVWQLWVYSHLRFVKLTKTHAGCALMWFWHRYLLVTTIFRLLLCIKFCFMPSLSQRLMTLLVSRISFLRLHMHVLGLTLLKTWIKICLRVEILWVKVFLIAVAPIVFTVTVAVTIRAAITISIAISVAGRVAVSVAVIIIAFKLLVELVFWIVAQNADERRFAQLGLEQFNFLLQHFVLDADHVGCVNQVYCRVATLW